MSSVTSGGWNAVSISAMAMSSNECLDLKHLVVQNMKKVMEISIYRLVLSQLLKVIVIA